MGTDPESILFTSEPSGKISYPLAYLFHKEKERERERSKPEALEWEHWLQDPWVSNSDNSHKGNHLNTRSSTPQPTVVPYAGCLIKTTKKQKYKPNNHQTGLLSHSALPIRGKTNKQTNKKETHHRSQSIQSLHKPLDQTLDSRNQKEEIIQTWSSGKGDLKENKFKKNYMKMQRNTTQMKEQTRNTKCNTWRGNRQTTWKRIQNNDSKETSGDNI